MNSSLYKNVVRVLENWPVVPSKQGRDFGEFIRLHVSKSFGPAAASQQNSNTWEEICSRLQRISGDHYKKAFGVSRVSSALGLTEQQCHDALSNEFLKALEEEDQSTKTKVLNKFRREESS